MESVGIHLATLISSFDLILFVFVFGTPFFFIVLLGKHFRNWNSYARIKKAFVFGHGVMAILCITATSTVFYLFFQSSKVQEADDQLFVLNLCFSVFDTGRYEIPEGSQSEKILRLAEVEALSGELSTIDIRFDSDGNALDPWRNALRWEPGALQNVYLFSAGPDGRFSTADDLPEPVPEGE